MAVDGHEVEMVFLTDHLEWAASSVEIGTGGIVARR
jgi:hypothetical protein